MTYRWEWVYWGYMNIYCEWKGDVLVVKSGNTEIAKVEPNGGEPVFCYESNSSLSFFEIEHIMDCWFNQPKN